MANSDTEHGGIVNRCQADRERRERAWNDAALSERQGDMERHIIFEVGYDHTAFPEDCGGGGHGRHGMNLRFVLVGPKGAVQWLAYMTSWVPGNVRHGTVDGLGDVSLVPLNSTIGDGMAADLGYHSPVPRYGSQSAMKCEWLPEGECYYDGSGLNAEPLLEAFLNHGPHAVWAALAHYYTEVLATEPDPEAMEW